MDDEIPVHGDSHASSSHEVSLEPTFKRRESFRVGVQRWRFRVGRLGFEVQGWKFRVRNSVGGVGEAQGGKFKGSAVTCWRDDLRRSFVVSGTIFLNTSGLRDQAATVRRRQKSK